MIRCLSSQRHLKEQKGEQDQLKEDVAMEEFQSAVSIQRLPGIKLQAGVIDRVRSQPNRGANWLLGFFDGSETDTVCESSFHLASLQAPHSHMIVEEVVQEQETSTCNAQTTGEVCQSPREQGLEDAKQASEEIFEAQSAQETESTGATRDSHLFGNDMTSAIRNMINDATDSFGEECGSGITDSIADELLRELERAAAQVAEMEVELTLSRQRLEVSETRRRYLEEELAAYKLTKEKNLSENLVEQSEERWGEETSQLSNDAVERSLKFLQEICRDKDKTILELEQEVDNLQNKMCDLLKVENQHATPMTVNELLVKFSSNTSRSPEVSGNSGNSTIRKKLCGKKPNRKNASTTISSGGSVLVDITPNVPLENVRNFHPTKKLKR